MHLTTNPFEKPIDFKEDGTGSAKMLIRFHGLAYKNTPSLHHSIRKLLLPLLAIVSPFLILGRVLVMKNGKKLLFCCGCVAVKPVMPRCSVPEAVTVGSSPELRCIENEGFPQSLYQWFKNNEELPEDPKTSSKFYNSTYTMNTETGSLVSVLCYHACENISYFLFSFFKTRGIDYPLRNQHRQKE